MKFNAWSRSAHTFFKMTDCMNARTAAISLFCLSCDDDDDDDPSGACSPSAKFKTNGMLSASATRCTSLYLRINIFAKVGDRSAMCESPINAPDAFSTMPRCAVSACMAGVGTLPAAPRHMRRSSEALMPAADCTRAPAAFCNSCVHVAIVSLFITTCICVETAGGIECATATAIFQVLKGKNSPRIAKGTCFTSLPYTASSSATTDDSYSMSSLSSTLRMASCNTHNACHVTSPAHPAACKEHLLSSHKDASTCMLV
jgi:hypothetical protein